MTHKQLDPSDFVLLLRDIIARWPKANGEDVATYHMPLSSYLTDTFQVVDLHNRIEAVANIGGVEMTNSRVQIDFYDVDECLHRAVFKPFDGNGNEWRLESVKFQCPVCFGEGVNDGDQCNMCGGTGWGVSDGGQKGTGPFNDH